MFYKHFWICRTRRSILPSQTLYVYLPAPARFCQVKIHHCWNTKTFSALISLKCFQGDSVYTDFYTAFDKVDHFIFVSKLYTLGIHGDLLCWVTAYLSNRSQLAAINGDYSLPVWVISGVPQGSHLGPLFFVVFINDLINRLSCNCLLYVDDLRIYSNITRVENANKLQRDLDCVNDWCTQNRMFLNVLWFLLQKKNIHKNTHDYTLKNNNLARKTIIAIKIINKIYSHLVVFLEWQNLLNNQQAWFYKK